MTNPLARLVMDTVVRRSREGNSPAKIQYRDSFNSDTDSYRREPSSYKTLSQIVESKAPNLNRRESSRPSVDRNVSKRDLPARDGNINSRQEELISGIINGQRAVRDRQRIHSPISLDEAVNRARRK